tara:strand:+ start:4108 stop:4503 length:396 start_codon:yes stop_codon:yes gene_type:complete
MFDALLPTPFDPAPFARTEYSTTCEIKASIGIDDAEYRWLYDVQVVLFSGSIDAVEFEDSGDELKAINVREFGNTADNVGGFDPADLPATFDFGPVQGYVVCWSGYFSVEDGEAPVPVLLFSVENPIEGSC